MIQTQINTGNPFKDLGQGVCGQSVTLPCISLRKELKIINRYNAEESVQGLCPIPPQITSPKVLKFYGSVNAHLTNKLVSGLLMSSDMNSYPLQIDQLACRMLTWINPSRKDLPGEQRLALSMDMQFRQGALNITGGG